MIRIDWGSYFICLVWFCITFRYQIFYKLLQVFRCFSDFVQAAGHFQKIWGTLVVVRGRLLIQRGTYVVGFCSPLFENHLICRMQDESL